MIDFETLRDSLENNLKEVYTDGISTEGAQNLAAEFIVAMSVASRQLKTIDLDARMKKAGLKVLKSKVRSDEVSKHDKKPADSILDDVVNLDEKVQAEQLALDEAEVQRDELQRCFDTFREAEQFLRSVMKSGD